MSVPLLSANEVSFDVGSALRKSPSGFVVIGNPGTPRIDLFQSALNQHGLPSARIVSWMDAAAGRGKLAEVVRNGDVIRLESPGRDFEVERAMLLAGAEENDPDDQTCTYQRLSRHQTKALRFDKGKVVCPRQWFLGFRAVLRNIAQELTECPPHWISNPVADVETMFDKRHCQARLLGAGAAVPMSIAPVASFAELQSSMAEAGLNRVFVKLANGSSASGVVAYAFNARGDHRAVSTVEMVRTGGELHFYNSRQLQTYNEPRQIAQLIDALAGHRIHVERWLPKAAINGKTFDLRIVVIGGRACHNVARLSHSPLTNLHLLNERSDTIAIRRRMGEKRWNAAMAECERAMSCFPQSLHGGVDLLISADFRRHAILEINAFGDHLRDVTWRGASTYETEVAVLLGIENFGQLAEGSRPHERTH